MDNQNKRKKGIEIVNALIFIAAVAGIAWIAMQFVHIGVEYTDNAQVHRHITPINSRL